jgi:hypothetical protein
MPQKSTQSCTWANFLWFLSKNNADGLGKMVKCCIQYENNTNCQTSYSRNKTKRCKLEGKYLDLAVLSALTAPKEFSYLSTFAYMMAALELNAWAASYFPIIWKHLNRNSYTFEAWFELDVAKPDSTNKLSQPDSTQLFLESQTDPIWPEIK